MEKDRKLDYPTCLWSPNLWQRKQKHTVEIGQSSLISGAEKFGTDMLTCEIRTLPSIIHKNKLKMN